MQQRLAGRGGEEAETETGEETDSDLQRERGSLQNQIRAPSVGPASVVA